MGTFAHYVLGPSVNNSLFPVRGSEKVFPPRRPRFCCCCCCCWNWVPKSVSGPRVGKTLCTRATAMFFFFLLMIRTEVKIPTDEKSWKRISLRFEKEFGLNLKWGKRSIICRLIFFISNYSGTLSNNFMKSDIVNLLIIER